MVRPKTVRRAGTALILVAAVLLGACESGSQSAAARCGKDPVAAARAFLTAVHRPGSPAYRQCAPSPLSLVGVTLEELQLGPWDAAAARLVPSDSYRGSKGEAIVAVPSADPPPIDTSGRPAHESGIGITLVGDTSKGFVIRKIEVYASS